MIRRPVWFHIPAVRQPGTSRSVLIPTCRPAPWPTGAEFDGIAEPVAEGGFEAAVDIMTAIRGAKTVAQKSLRWPVAGLEITGSEAARAALAPMMDDILRAGNVVEDGLTVSEGTAPEGDRFAITVTLADTND